MKAVELSSPAMPVPDDEPSRMDALMAYHLMDSAREVEFDEIVQLAARICETPIAVISLVDEDRQWLKAQVGLSLTQTPRYIAFCAHTILQSELMVVSDTHTDARFANNILVTGEPHLRSYIGAPLITAEGYALGTLSVMDTVPRQLNEQQMFALGVLSRQVMNQLEAKRSIAKLNEVVIQRDLAQVSLRQIQEQLEARVIERTHELSALNAAYEETNHFFTTLWETTTDAVLVIDAQDNILYASPAAWKVLGYLPEQLIGENLSMIQPERLRQSHKRGMQRYLQESIKILDWGSNEVFGLRPDGTETALEVAFSEMNLDGKRLFVGFFRDITERVKAQAELAYAASHDPVTGLALYPLVEKELSCALTGNAPVSVFFIDLDHFHAINESMGPQFGDDALRQIAERLSEVVGDSGQVGRFAGDEFVVVVPGLNPSQAHGLAEALRLAISPVLICDGFPLLIQASIGLTWSPEHGVTPADLVRRAEAAMTRAKRQGRNCVCAFSTEQMHELEDRLTLGAHLRVAIARGELELHYQPQIRASDHRLVGFEALTRWYSSAIGQVNPARFIPTAEALGLMLEIGDWVLGEACRQARAWLDLGHQDFTIAVNMSAQQLQRPGVVEQLRELLSKYNLPAQILELELTESSLMENVDRVQGTLGELKNLGVSLSLDDFGTGYSSLAYLRQFALDKLKIDQSFVRDLPENPDAIAIARTIVAMGHQLRMSITAEGVETAGQGSFLREIGCDELQGYYYGRPANAVESEKLLRQRVAGD